jgi:hypothetical protein
MKNKNKVKILKKMRIDENINMTLILRRSRSSFNRLIKKKLFEKRNLEFVTSLNMKSIVNASTLDLGKMNI